MIQTGFVTAKNMIKQDLFRQLVDCLNVGKTPLQTVSDPLTPLRKGR
jgi:hypothetical protein